MTTLAAPTGNEIQDELAASYTRGTDTEITLTDGASFVNSTPLGHVVRINSGSKWCLVIYDNKTDADTLEMGAVDDYALAVNLGGGAAVDEVFPIGSTVELVCAADEIAQEMNSAIHVAGASEILGIAQDAAPIGTHELLSENAAGTKKAILLSDLAYGNPPLGQGGNALWTDRTYEGYEVVDTATEYTIGAAGDFATLFAAAAVLQGLILVASITLKFIDDVTESAGIEFKGMFSSGGVLVIDLDSNTHTFTGTSSAMMSFAGPFSIEIKDGTMELDPASVNPSHTGIQVKNGAFLWLWNTLTIDGKSKAFRELTQVVQTGQILWNNPTCSNVNVATIALRIDKARAMAYVGDPATTNLVAGGLLVTKDGNIITEAGTFTP